MKGIRAASTSILMLSAACAPPPAAPAGPNSPPAIAGDATCYSEIGAQHIFDLTLTDPDGDRVSWRAHKQLPQGALVANSGSAVASGSVIRIVYKPPPAADENWIEVTATDTRGGTTRLTLHARNR